ncbi:MAG TPA: hypothetical protein VJK29_21965 [Terriglobales bacterium]|nr:hypothetical protein [Terriglobales bacterium]
MPKHAKRIDPDLREQLNNARSSAAKLSVIVKLRHKDGSERSLSPEETERVAEVLLRHVRERVDETEQDYKCVLLKNLSVLSVEASASFLSELLRQPEVAGATLAEGEASAYIPPIRQKEITLKVNPGRSRRR